MGEIHFSLNHLVSIVTIIVGILIVFFVSFQKKNSKKEISYFKWYLSALVFTVFLFYLIDLKLNFKWLNLSIINFILPTILSLPPLMWLYLKRMLNQNESKKEIIHFIPSISVFFITILSTIIVLFSKNRFFIDVLIGIAFFSLLVVFIGQNIYYISKSIKSLVKHKNLIQNVYSYSEDVDLSWVKGLIVGYISLIMSVIIVNNFEDKTSNVFFNCVILFYLIFIGNKAIQQKSVAVENFDFETNKNIIKDKSISENQKEVFKKIKEELIEVMEKEKPYLDHSLNIFNLAKKLNTNSKYLSQVINQEFGKSFIHFINEYRVEAAKEELLKESNYTIEAKSYMVGFKSKSSFNIAFKKHIGMTPSEYIQSQGSII